MRKRIPVRVEYYDDTIPPNNYRVEIEMAGVIFMPDMRKSAGCMSKAKAKSLAAKVRRILNPPKPKVRKGK